MMKVLGGLRWRMTLRCFFALLTVGCVWLGFIVDRWHRQERAKVAILSTEGNSVIYESLVDADGCQFDNPPESVPPPSLLWLEAAPQWLQQPVAPLVQRHLT